MAAFALVTLQPKGYLHVAAFREIQLLLFSSLLDLGHDVVLTTNRFPEGRSAIVFGAHLISETFPVDLPADSILFNTEQLIATQESTITQRILRLAEQHPIWDYATANLFLLTQFSSQTQLHRLRLGHHPKMEQVPAAPLRHEGDFLFYGSITPLRKEILSRINLSERLRIQAFFGVYGWHRDRLLAGCRAVLNLHSQPVRLLEWPRIVWLVANAIPCIALLHPQTQAEDQQCSYLLAAEERDPTAELEAWFHAPQLLEAHARQAQQRFRDQEPQLAYTEALLDAALASGFQPAAAAVEDPGWIRCTFQRDPDPLWYQHTYQFRSLDPRTLRDFHHQEGCFRQYHPDPAFHACFRPPLRLSQPAEPSQPEPLRCAVVLHFHSEHRAHQFFASYGCHLACRADFLITVSAPILATIVPAICLDYAANVVVQLIENRGRDIPSKYIVFNQQLSHYDLCLFSHDQQSDAHWFHDHNQLLAGSRQRVEAIVQRFAEQPELGLLFPDYLPSSIPWIGWGNLRRQVDALLARSGRSTRRINLLEFPAGGFFWARPRALGVLQDLALQPEDLPEPPREGDDSLLQGLECDDNLLLALERMPCLSCEFQGLRWEKIARELPLPLPTTAD